MSAIQSGTHIGVSTTVKQPGALQAKNEIFVDGSTYQVHIADNMDMIHALRLEWSKLEGHSQGFDYFQSYGWCAAWLSSHCSTGSDLYSPRVYSLFKGGHMICVLPMMIEMKHGLKNLRMVSEPLGQYSNLLANAELFSVSIGREFLKFIQRNEKVDSILFSQYPSDGYLDQMVGDYGFVEKSQMESSIATLSGYDSWEQFQEANLSTKLRKERRRRSKKLSSQGDVEYKVFCGGTDEYQELIAHALEMKAEWLKETGRRSDQLLSAETELFLKSLNGDQGRENHPPQGAVAHALMVDGQPVAIELGMTLHKHYYCYLGAFDYSWRKFSVGKIQMELAQKWAFENGIEDFDFLGDPSDYKANWTQAKHELKSRYIPISAKGFLYVVIWRAYMRPVLKSAYAAMGTDWRKKLGFFINIAEKIRSGKSATVPVDRI